MENSDEFKKKLEALAKAKEAKEKERQEAGVNSLNEMLKTRKLNQEKFNKFKRDIVFRVVEQSRNAFMNSGDSILLYDNEHASGFEDRIKNFFQILYYYKGRPFSIVGRNTPSILYELNDATGKIRVSHNYRLNFLQNKFEEINVDSLNKEIFEAEVLQFLTNLTSS